MIVEEKNMKLKKIIIVTCCVIIASLGILLTGCSDSNSDKYADSPYVGVWMIDHFELEGKESPYPGLFAFTFNADGSASLEDVSETIEGEWEPTEDGVKFTDVEEDTYITYEDGNLKMEIEHEKGKVMMYFYKKE